MDITIYNKEAEFTEKKAILRQLGISPTPAEEWYMQSQSTQRSLEHATRNVIKMHWQIPVPEWEI